MSEVIPKEQARGLKAHKILVGFVVKDEETCTMLTETEAEVSGFKLKATRTLSKDPEIVTLTLRNLPFDDPSELEAGLKLALGKVLDVSLHHEMHGGFFLGTGVATVDITPPKTDKE